MTGEGPLINVHRGPQGLGGLPSPDVYFTPGYGRAASVTECGEWVLLEAFDGAWQVPLVVRTMADGTNDAISPYGYAGVYALPSLSARQIRSAWSATLSCLRELGVISILLRHSPLVPQATALPGLRPVVSGHPTFVLEPAGPESAWTDMKQTCRTATRKAMKNGYTGKVRAASGQDLAPGSDFRRLYDETMHRVDAAPLYYFSDDYYTQLLEGLGPDLLIAEVRDNGGLVASSSLLLRHETRLHGHLACSNRDDARLGANNLLDWTVIQFALEEGMAQYHLGGGLEPHDSLYRFKRSFGGRELKYNISGVILDDMTYRALVESRAKECETTSEALLASGFFPTYRGGVA